MRKDVLPPLEAVLEIANSTMTYRYRYLASLQLAPVLDLILVDETNPRAVGFQLAALAEHVKNLPGEAADAEQRPEPRIVMAAQAGLRLCDVDAFCEPDEIGPSRKPGRFPRPAMRPPTPPVRCDHAALPVAHRSLAPVGV